MFRELGDARRLLEEASERYSNACAVVRDHAHLSNFNHNREHSARMANELAAITACQDKINHAKKSISQAINHSPFVARIHTLPVEILGRIFQIAIGLQPCFEDLNNPDLEFDRRTFICAHVPERLSHVCARWRWVAFGLPTLWQHIDVYADLSGALDCADARMSRVGGLPLDLHIVGSLFEVDKLEQWLVSAAPRMKSLNLIIRDMFNTHESILATCFRHCSPETFSHLTIWKEAETRPDHEHDLLIGFTNPLLPGAAELDNAFRRLESLRIRQIYPHWTHPAYHGLSELHLASHRSSQSEPLTIPLLRLVGILQSSPQLRVIRLDLKITEDEQGGNGLPSPVHLSELEVLDLSTESRDPDLEQLELVLPLLAPGTKPLQLTLDHLDEDKYLLLRDIVQEFFVRSNVTRLKLVFPEFDYQELDFDLLSSLAPQLRDFVLDHYSWEEYSDDMTVPYPRFHQRDNSAPNSRLDYLYLHHCRIDLSPCSKLLGNLTHPPRVLVFWKCMFMEGGERVADEQEIRGVFQDVSQDVRILKWDTAKPPDDWFSADNMPRIY